MATEVRARRGAGGAAPAADADGAGVNGTGDGGVLPSQPRPPPPPPPPPPPRPVLQSGWRLASTVLPAVLAVLYAGALASVYWTKYDLPAPLREADTPIDKFCEERAHKTLVDLINLGVRDTGSWANEVAAPRLLLRELRRIKERAPPWMRVEVSLQRVSGSLELDFLKTHFNSAYRNVTNIACRISRVGDGSDAHVANAILVSSHFDSHPDVPGAADDGASVAVMVELARNLATERWAPAQQAAVIFLWNGAEETVMQGAHGFITQHPWAASVRAFINLESAGGGGRSTMFQLGPRNAWLARAYADAAPLPLGSVLSQEIFESGIIPLDDDFRVYRDYGGVPGLDLAFFEDGYSYHTVLDQVARIRPGTLQGLGANLGAAVRALQGSPFVSGRAGPDHPYVTANAVYYTIFSRWMVAYTQQAAVKLHTVALAGFAVVAVGQRWWRPVSTLPRHRGRRRRAWLAVGASAAGAFVAPLAVAAVLMASGVRMSWYGEPVLLTGLFLAASLLGIAAGQEVIRPAEATRSGKTGAAANAGARSANGAAKGATANGHSTAAEREVVAGGAGGPAEAQKQRYEEERQLLAEEDEVRGREVEVWRATMTVVALALAALTALGLRSAYQAMHILVWPLGVRLAWGAVPARVTGRRAVVDWAIAYAGGALVPVLIGIGLWLPLLVFLATQMGRGGPSVPSELLVAFLVAVPTVLNTIMVWSSLQLLTAAAARRLRHALVLVVLVSLIVATALPPYRPHRPQRLIMQHVTRSYYTTDTATGAAQLTAEDSGLWLNVGDANALGPLRAHSAELAGILAGAQERRDWAGVYGDMPFLFPAKEILSPSFYLPAPRPSPASGDAPPEPQPTLELRWSAVVDAAAGRRRWELTARGSDRITLYIGSQGVQVSAWSLGNGRPPLPRPGDTYFVVLVSASDAHVPEPQGADDAEREAAAVRYLLEEAPDADPAAAPGGAPAPVISWEFWLETEGDGPLTIALASHALQENSELIDRLEAALPDWATSVSCISHWASYTFPAPSPL